MYRLLLLDWMPEDHCDAFWFRAYFPMVAPSTWVGLVYRRLCVCGFLLSTEETNIVESRSPVCLLVRCLPVIRWPRGSGLFFFFGKVGVRTLPNMQMPGTFLFSFFFFKLRDSSKHAWVRIICLAETDNLFNWNFTRGIALWKKLIFFIKKKKLIFIMWL